MHLLSENRSLICLCMIVKNEAPVIRRCLESVRPLIGSWLIVDTGSTDGTQDIIRSYLQDLPGRLVERPWLNFAHNRSEALAFAREWAGYSLIIDADDTMVIADDFSLPDLVADSYTIEIVFGAIRYRRPQLVSNALPWRYEGVVHEFLSLPDLSGREVRSSQQLNQQFLQGVEIHIGEDGARRRTNDAARFRNDASVIESALEEETDPFLISRYTFYLAQSYEQGGEAELALETYLKRAEQGFWRDEVFMSLYRAAMIMERLGRPHDDVLRTLDRASAAHTQRAEAYFSASRLCRRIGRFAQGYEYACRGLRVERPSEGLFLVPWIYDYGLLDELSVNAFWCGEYRDCLCASRRLLLDGLIPASEINRIRANYNASVDKILLGSAAPGFASSKRSSDITLDNLLARANKMRTEAASPDDIVKVFRAAISADCDNLTAYHDAARYCREQQLFELGYRFAQEGLARLHPDAQSGDASAIARFGLHDEFAVNAYWSGHFLDCMLACWAILARGDLDDQLRRRVADNLRFAEDSLRLPFPRWAAFPAMKTGHVSILLATPEDYQHWRALDDIADALTFGFRRLGLLAKRVTTPFDAVGLCIVLGAHLGGSYTASELPDDAIIFNTEHHSSRWVQHNPDYKAILAARQVWDYGRTNSEFLRSELGANVTFVKIGFVPELRRVDPSGQQPIDVLHYGSVSPRRTKALNVIGQSGLSIVSGFNVYGDVRDQLIARSKVVVNIHFYEPGVIELPRISYLLANGKAVVTECADGEIIDPDLRTALCAVPYTELAETCHSLAKNDARRRELEGAAIAYSLEWRQEDILRDVLISR